MNRTSTDTTSAAANEAEARQLAREEAEERRWQLEWDRRNVED